MFFIERNVYIFNFAPKLQERPYHIDSTASRLLSEVKQCRARLVLRWGTTLESLVLFFCIFFILPLTLGDHVGIPGVALLHFLFYH